MPGSTSEQADGQGREQAGEPARESSSGKVDEAQRLAEIFGDVLPESTSDDRDPRTAQRGDDSLGDSWYTENRPPHHDAR